MAYILGRLGNLPRLTASTAYHTTSITLFPYKDSQNRESLKPQTAENTKSGRDDDAAVSSKAAFSRHTTSPEAARAAAAKDANVDDPLEVSGANPGLSKPHGNGKKQ